MVSTDFVGRSLCGRTMLGENLQLQLHFCLGVPNQLCQSMPNKRLLGMPNQLLRSCACEPAALEAMLGCAEPLLPLCQGTYSGPASPRYHLITAQEDS